MNEPNQALWMPAQTSHPTTKSCPYCMETIHVGAIRCKHCQADLTVANAALMPVRPPKKRSWVIRFLLWWIGMGAGRYGRLNSALQCPHCKAKGFVRTKRVQRKKGISGGKAVGAIFTGGLSMLATGLSRKEQVTACRCDHCRSEWDF